MPKPLEIKLSEAQRRELEDMRDHDPRPYLRERAAAILKVAGGQSGRQVALTGLLKAREPDAVYRWIKGYREQGKDGLEIRGRGRKPAFSPSARDEPPGTGSPAAYHPTCARTGRAARQPLDPETVAGRLSALVAG